MPDDIPPISNDTEQALALRNEITAVIHRFRREYNMSMAAAIGTMFIVTIELYNQQQSLIKKGEEE